MEKTKEDIKKILESGGAVKVLYIIGIIIVAMIIFHVGNIVGFNKASYGRAWGEHYNENFGMGYRNDGRPGGMMGGLSMPGFFPNAHGVVGKIIKIELPNIIVQDKDSLEKIVLLKENTGIQYRRDNIKTTDLKIGDFVVIIGSPNDKGQIEAELVRLMPSPEFLK